MLHGAEGDELGSEQGSELYNSLWLHNSVGLCLKQDPDLADS